MSKWRQKYDFDPGQQQNNNNGINELLQHLSTLKNISHGNHSERQISVVCHVLKYSSSISSNWSIISTQRYSSYSSTPSGTQQLYFLLTNDARRRKIANSPFVTSFIIIIMKCILLDMGHEQLIFSSGRIISQQLQRYCQRWLLSILLAWDFVTAPEFVFGDVVS